MAERGIRQPPAGRAQPAGDFIEVYDAALERSFCTDLIARFEHSPHRRAGQTGGGLDPDRKLSTDLRLSDHAEFGVEVGYLEHILTDFLTQYFARYRFALIAPIGLTVRHPVSGEAVALNDRNFSEIGEPQLWLLMKSLYRIGPIQVQKYDPRRGNYDYWHCEVFPERRGTDALHRTLFWLAYLNDVTSGGHTEFYYQNRSIAPQAGRLLVAPAYFTHTHRGRTPVSGDKYIATGWVMIRPAEQLYRSTQQHSAG